MTVEWMLQALLAGVLLGVGALAAERAVGWFGRPRRALWAAAMLGSLLLPALSLWLPGFLPDLGIIPDSSSAIAKFDASDLQRLGGTPEGSLGGVGAVAGAHALELSAALGMGWLVASLTMLGAVALTYRRLRTVRATSVPTEVDGIAVQVTDRTGPAVVGLVRPVVVVPRWVLDASADERRLILLHEREHVAGRDAWLLFLGTIAVSAMPWNLPLWWQHHRLRLAVETDCDARVLAHGVNRHSYGRALIRAASSIPSLPLLSPAWGESTSQLERRIMTMTAKRPEHRLLRALPLLAISAGVILTACEVAGNGDTQARERAPTAPSASEAPSMTGVRGPAAHATGVGVDTVRVAVSPPRDRSWGDLGVRGVSWPNHGGPRVDREKGAQKPTVHPVVQVDVGGSAWKGGVRDGDAILTVNGHDSRVIGPVFPDRRPGTRYAVRVRRGEQELDLEFEVGPSADQQDRSR